MHPKVVNIFSEFSEFSLWWTERELNPRPPECKSSLREETAFRLSSYDETGDLLRKFREFLLVDLRRGRKTTYEAVRVVGNFLDSLECSEVSRETVRCYLKQIDGESKYRNILAAFKRFFRDFLEKPELVSTFKFPAAQFKPKLVPCKDDLQKFFNCLDSELSEALFLFYASTGLRKNEVLSLTLKDIDFEKRMVVPKCHKGFTKSSYLSFYNEEAESSLSKIKSNNGRLFQISDRQYKKIWKSAREKTGLNITPQRLREWFCCEMGSLGVSDRYIDAFCGRTPKSVLARHYTDYNPERLKKIYDGANLKVLI